MAAKKKSKNHVALLRGINVGGHNIISKGDLISCFEDLGFEDVQTYIQSGNIVFRSDSTSVSRITKKVEDGLTSAFHYAARAVVFSESEYNETVAKAHKSWAKNDDRKHNAMFLLPELRPEALLDELPKPVRGIETVSMAERAVFWSASREKLTKTTMMKLSKTKYYKLMTVRNHNTTLKLQSMLESLGEKG